MLKIGIDGRALEGQLTGIGRYVYELCRELDILLKNAEFFIYSRTPLNVPLFSERWHSRVEPVNVFRQLKSSLWLKVRCGMHTRKDKLDVFWGTATLLPSLKPWVRTIVTVHDLNYLIVPKTMSTANMLAHRLFFCTDVLNADIVLANSKGTANRLQQLLGRGADGIVCPSINTNFTTPNSKIIQVTMDKYGIKSPYHLSVATWEPRKNLELLISTYIDIKRDMYLPDHQLVLVGGKGWKDDKLLGILREAPPETIVPLGYVDDADLPALYAGADAFIFPSIYEGFGIPLLEARACGTLVIASDTPELRESGGDAIFIQPTKKGIRKGILESLSVPKREPEILPSWNTEAKKLAEVLLNEEHT